MGKYHAALVKFTEHGRSYPANCCEIGFDVGDEVLVRMPFGREKIKSAEITEIIRTNSPCKNSVVCLSSDAHEYSGGPYGIKLREQLERFLLFNGFRAFKTTPNSPADAWWVDLFPLAYIQGLDYQSWECPGPLSCTFFPGPYKLILIGETHVSPFSAGASREDYEYTWIEHSTAWRIVIKDDHLLLSSNLVTHPFKGSNNLFMAAEWIEDTVWPVRNYKDTTISDIRSVLNDGSGGPFYLGDDVWI